MQHPPRFTDRIRPRANKSHEAQYHASHSRHAFHKPHTSLGGIGHWVKTAGILAPMLIGEFIEDPGKKWRAVRLITVAATLLSEGLYTNKIRHERKHARECEHELQP